MSITITIRVKKEILELADEMVKYGLASSRSNAINIMIEKGLQKVKEEVEFWRKAYKTVEELKQKNYIIEHGGISKILHEDRE